MTRRDLVRAAIGHEETCRCPYLIRLTPEAAGVIQQHTGVANAYDWLDNDVHCLSIPWWNWYKLGHDWRGWAAPSSPATAIGSGSYDKLPDRIKAERDQSDKYFLVLIYGSHFEKAYFARGFENFLADIAGDYAFAKKLCRIIIQKNLVMLENFLPIAEIDGVLLGSDWGAQKGPLIRPEVWDDLIRPGEQLEYDLIHAYGKDVWVHSCGSIEPLVPRLVEMGLDVLNPIQPECMDIARLKADYGHRLAFWGGISTQHILPFGSPEEVQAESIRVRDLLSQGGGYVFSPSQDIQGDVPFENIVALLETARQSFR